MSQNERQTSTPSQQPSQPGNGATGQRQGIGVGWTRNSQEPIKQTKSS